MLSQDAGRPVQRGQRTTTGAPPVPTRAISKRKSRPSRQYSRPSDQYKLCSSRAAPPIAIVVQAHPSECSRKVGQIQTGHQTQASGSQQICYQSQRVAVCPSTMQRHTPSEIQVEQPSILVIQGDYGIYQQQATEIRRAVQQGSR